MSGFVGFVGQIDADSEKTIKAMKAAIAHRGPDGNGYHIDKAAALGVCRLATGGLNTQTLPVYNEDKTMLIVFDGIIYNHKELRSELEAKGHVFSTDLDMEAVLHGHEEYGEKVLDKLRGVYAFVVWNELESKAFGARDIFGIRPFYYYKNDNLFMFASESKAFLAHPGFKKELNAGRLPEYLTFEYIPDEETLFRNVNKLLAAHCFTYEKGEFKAKKYFELRYAIEEDRNLDYWVDAIEETFRKSVNIHKSQADVEVGSFLSSGVDSSYVLAEYVKTDKVKAISVGYSEEKFSELASARSFAKLVGAEHIITKVTADDFFGIAPYAQYQMDEPLPNPSAIPLFFLACEASKHVKTVLSGEGADELFGGYSYYTEPLEFENYQKLPGSLRNLLSAIAKRLPAFHGKNFLIKGSQPIEKRFIRNTYVFSVAERNKLLAKPTGNPEPWTFNKPIFERAEGLDDVTKMQFVDMQSWAVFDIFQKADKMSMANSLELRMPFLDKEVLAIALRIPVRFRVSREQTKIALRKAALRQMPEQYAEKKKLGFPVPLNDWLRDDKYYELVKSTFQKDFAKEFFNIDYALKLLDDHKSGKSANMKKIWSIYCFLIWYEEYFIKR